MESCKQTVVLQHMQQQNSNFNKINVLQWLHDIQESLKNHVKREKSKVNLNFVSGEGSRPEYYNRLGTKVGTTFGEGLRDVLEMF